MCCLRLVCLYVRPLVSSGRNMVLVSLRAKESVKFRRISQLNFREPAFFKRTFIHLQLEIINRQIVPPRSIQSRDYFPMNLKSSKHVRKLDEDAN